MNDIAQVINNLGSQWITYLYFHTILDNVLGLTVCACLCYGAYRAIKAVADL